MKTNIILQGDCLELMKQIEDKSIDLVLTDPPYNISRKTNFSSMKGHRGTSMEFGKWDENTDITSFIKEIPRILKIGANVVIFNCWENLGDISKIMKENNIEPKRCLVLNKSNPAPFNRDRMFVNDVEFAIWGVFKNENWTFNRINKLEKCIFNTTVQGRMFHPTMKDIKVIERLLLLLSNEGDIILDPFLGSGTTAIACLKLNRKFIGIEKEPDYVKIANARIKPYLEQRKL